MNTTKFDFNDVFALMREAFPKNEYRNYERQKALIENPYYKIIPYFGSDKNLIAFAAIWDFQSFKFVEHIAVGKQCRGMGIGSKIMQDIIENANSEVILEIEPPNNETSIKRLHFYEKLGFKLNDYEYFQPPLNENDKPIPLKIMSYSQKISEQKFEEFKNTIYSNVYAKN